MVALGELRPLIAQSWQRSREAGVGREQPGASLVWDEHALASARAHHAELVTAASPVLAQLTPLLAGEVLILCDPHARILSVDGDARARIAAERVGLVAGADWSEPAAGTNAMGLCAVHQGAASVIATEHFLESLHPWACAAAPIRCPTTGRVLGLVDLTGLHMAISPHTFLAVTGGARAVEAELARWENTCRAALLEARLDRLQHSRTGLVAVLDRRGALLHAPHDLPAVAPHHWADLLSIVHRTGQELEAELPGPGDSPARVRIRPVRLEGRIIGAVAEADQARSADSVHAPRTEPALPGLIGRSPAWLAALERTARAARTGSTVVLTGETGTGKEVLARAIHQASSRARGPFVPVNCGALPTALATSELFGYVGGAFTGAHPKGSPGKVEAAHGGTLFLDEVSELPPEAQVALLRVLQEREVVRVGAHRAIPVDVRIVAATNRDLAAMVERGEFRQDLYFRLNVVPIAIAPLRERREDVLPLIEYAYRRLGQEPPDLSFASWERLTTYRWPGNVRELLNLVEQAVALDEDPASLLPLPPLQTAVQPLAECGEEERIREALAACGSNAAAAARLLGMSRSTLYRKLELYDIRLARHIQ